MKPNLPPCQIDGHKIVSIVDKEIVEPHIKQIYHSYHTVCERCGETLTEIRSKLKEVANGNAGL